MKKIFLLLGIALLLAQAKIHAYPTDVGIYKSTFMAGNAGANANISKISTGNIVVVDYLVTSTGAVNPIRPTLDIFDSGQATATAVKSWIGFPIQNVGQQISLGIEVTSGAYANVNGLDAGTTVYIRWYRKSKN